MFVPFALPRFQAFDSSGAFFAGGKLHTYKSGTACFAATYPDRDATNPSPNPITLDAQGEAAIWLEPTTTYRFELWTNSGDALVWMQDGVTGVTSSVALAGAQGSELVGFQQAYDTSILRTLLSKAREIVSVGDQGDVSSEADCSVAFQHVADLCETGRGRYLYVPNFDQNYQFNTTVSFITPGVRIFGNQSASYNRGVGKDGWIETAANPAFDLGKSRTTGNPADQWQIDGISLKQKGGLTARSVDGVRFTTRTNGPDRGAIIRNTSFVGLHDAITIENPDISTVLASLSLDGVVVYNCDSAVNAKGNLLGLSIQNCQIEQNGGTDGVIKGSINGTVTIKNNMLEGQPNVLSIRVPPVTGNRPFVDFSYNYLEANSGAYVVRYQVTAIGSLNVGPNYAVNMLAADYVLFEGGGGGIVLLTMNDPFPFVFKNSGVEVRYGSLPFGPTVRSYGVRQLTAQVPRVVIADFQGLVDLEGTHQHASLPIGTSRMTPYGMKNTVAANTIVDIAVPVNIGDLVEVDILIAMSEITAGSLRFQMLNVNSSTEIMSLEANATATDLKGRYALVSIPFISAIASTAMRLRVLSSSGVYEIGIAGVAARNYGAFENDGSMKMLITPVVPNIA